MIGDPKRAAALIVAKIAPKPEPELDESDALKLALFELKDVWHRDDMDKFASAFRSAVELCLAEIKSEDDA